MHFQLLAISLCYTARHPSLSLSLSLLPIPSQCCAHFLFRHSPENGPEADQISRTDEMIGEMCTMLWASQSAVAQ